MNMKKLIDAKKSLEDLKIFNFHDFSQCKKIEILIDFNTDKISVNYFNSCEIDEIRVKNINDCELDENYVNEI